MVLPLDFPLPLRHNHQQLVVKRPCLVPDHLAIKGDVFFLLSMIHTAKAVPDDGFIPECRNAFCTAAACSHGLHYLILFLLNVPNGTLAQDVLAGHCCIIFPLSESRRATFSFSVITFFWRLGSLPEALRKLGVYKAS